MTARRFAEEITSRRRQRTRTASLAKATKDMGRPLTPQESMLIEVREPIIPMITGHRGIGVSWWLRGAMDAIIGLRQSPCDGLPKLLCDAYAHGYANGVESLQYGD